MKASSMTQKQNGWGSVLSLGRAGRFWCLSALVLLATAVTAVAKQSGHHTRLVSSGKTAAHAATGSKSSGRTHVTSSRSGTTAHHKSVKKASSHKRQGKSVKSVRHSNRRHHSLTASSASGKKSSTAAKSRQV